MPPQLNFPASFFSLCQTFPPSFSTSSSPTPEGTGTDMGAIRLLLVRHGESVDNVASL